MNEIREDMPSQEVKETAISAQPDSVDEQGISQSNRRQLIVRYGKYALAAAPLLLFASQAKAIHSKP